MLRAVRQVLSCHSVLAWLELVAAENHVPRPRPAPGPLVRGTLVTQHQYFPMITALSDMASPSSCLHGHT
jgi:hypothetical protein